MKRSSDEQRAHKQGQLRIIHGQIAQELSECRTLHQTLQMRRFSPQRRWYAFFVLTASCHFASF